MRHRVALRLLAGTVLAIGAAWVGSLHALARGLDLGLYLLANLMVSLDFLDLMLRVHFRRRHTRLPGPGGSTSTSVPLDVGRFAPYQMRLHLRPYALVVSVHNAEEELDDFLEAMAPHRNRLWVIDDASTDDTWFLLQRSGIPAIQGSPNRKKPGALKELLAILPPEIETVVVLDPDVRICEGEENGLSNLEKVVFEFQRSGMAAACPRFVLREDSLLLRLQSLEYRLALSLGRKSMADHSVTSGVAIYRRAALAQVLEQHTLSVYAEDLKNALILLSQGERIYYDERLVIETEGKRTWRAWFSQRVGWHYGLLKVYHEHWSDILRGARGRPTFAYQFLVYIGVFGLLLHPVKLVSLAILVLSLGSGLDVLLGLDWMKQVGLDPAYFLSAYLSYTGLVLVALALAGKGRERLSLLPVVPVFFFYVLAQIVPITVGYLNWLSVRALGRRLYRDHFQGEESLRLENEKAASPR